MAAVLAACLNSIKNVAVEHVFSHPDVEQRTAGIPGDRRIVDIYQPLLSLSLNDFRELVEKERFNASPISRAYFRNFLRAIVLATLKSSDTHGFGGVPGTGILYYRCRLIQDYISGMTDLYAWDEYRRLMAVEQ